MCLTTETRQKLTAPAAQGNVTCPLFKTKVTALAILTYNNNRLRSCYNSQTRLRLLCFGSGATAPGGTLRLYYN